VTASDFSVHVEQLLVTFGSTIYNVNVRTFEPVKAIGTVVFFHAFDGNGRDFQAQASYLAMTNYRVICPDMLGRGGSAFVVPPHVYTLKFIVESAAAVLARYATGDCVIVADEWGGVIALLAASLARTRVTHWVCADLTLDYRVEDDPAIARALQNSGQRFEATEQALLAVAGSETVARSLQQERLIHRLRVANGQLLPHYDDAIVNQIDVFRNRSDDLRPQLRALKGKLLLTYSVYANMQQAVALCREAPERRAVVHGRPTAPTEVSPTATQSLIAFIES